MVPLFPVYFFFALIILQIGIQQVPADLKRKAWDPVQVNVQKDQVSYFYFFLLSNIDNL